MISNILKKGSKDNPINLIADYAKKGVFIIPFMNVGKKLFGKDMFDKDNTGDIFGMVFHSPFMYRFDEYAAEHLMKTITGAEDGSEFVSAVVNGFVDEYNPFAGTALTEERGSSKESVWKVFSMPLHVPVPSLIRPIEDVRRNISSLGMPIHNEPRKGSADETRPRFMQAKPGTNPVMKNISRALNWISLGDSVDAGFLNIAPEDIEYILSSTLGTWWNIFDFATEKLFSPKGEMARYGKKLPVAGRFYYRGGSSLYDRVEDLKEEYDKAIPFEKRGKDTMGEGEFAEKEGHMDEIIERGANPAIDMYKEYKSQINELEEAYRTAIKVARNRRNSPEERKAASEEAEAALQGIRDLNYETGRAWEKSKETMNQ